MIAGLEWQFESMSGTVLLKDIVDALEMQFDEVSSFVDLDTGQVEPVSNTLLSEADESVGEEPDLSAWQKEDGKSSSELFRLGTSCGFRLSSTFTNGRSCRTSRVR
jgi:hypothetical protein